MGCLEFERLRTLFTKAIAEHGKLRENGGSAAQLDKSTKNIAAARRRLLNHEASHQPLESPKAKAMPTE